MSVSYDASQSRSAPRGTTTASVVRFSVSTSLPRGALDRIGARSRTASEPEALRLAAASADRSAATSPARALRSPSIFAAVSAIAAAVSPKGLRGGCLAASQQKRSRYDSGGAPSTVTAEV